MVPYKDPVFVLQLIKDFKHIEWLKIKQETVKVSRTQIKYTLPFEINSGIHREEIISMLLDNSNGIYHVDL